MSDGAMGSAIDIAISAIDIAMGSAIDVESAIDIAMDSIDIASAIDVESAIDIAMDSIDIAMKQKHDRYVPYCYIRFIYSPSFNSFGCSTTKWSPSTVQACGSCNEFLQLTRTLMG